MDCFHDFCLNCDRQSPDGAPFCSQACRLEDYIRAQPSGSSIPSKTDTLSFAPQRRSCPTLSTAGLGSGYLLAPAYKFPERAVTSQQSSRSNTQPAPLQALNGSCTQQAYAQHQHSNSDSSTSSYSSAKSESCPEGVSDKVIAEKDGHRQSSGHDRSAKRRRSGR